MRAQGERPLNCMLAGYFSRVVGSLLLRRTADTMAYLRRRQELLPALVRHVDTTSIAEVLVRLAGADDQRAFLPTTREWGRGCCSGSEGRCALCPGARCVLYTMNTREVRWRLRPWPQT